MSLSANENTIQDFWLFVSRVGLGENRMGYLWNSNITCGL